MSSENRQFLVRNISTKLILALIAALVLAFAMSSPATASREATAALAVAPADGGAVYNARCAICHGKDGKGLPKWREKGQPDFTSSQWQKSRTNAQIADAIRNGAGKFMPAWKGRLSDEEINALAARVRAFGKK